MNKFRLKWKIFAFLLGFCGLLLIILWLFQTVLLDYFYKKIKIAEMKSYTDTIVGSLNRDSLSELISEPSKHDEICIDIIFADGRPYYSADVLRDCAIHKMPLSAKLKLVSNARDNGGEFFEYIMNQHFFRPGGTRRMQSLVYVRLAEREGEAFAVFINSVISPVTATITTLRYQLYLVTVIMLLLSVLLAFIIAKRVSRPIEEINKSAKDLAGGNYNICFSGKGFLEIGELSDTLNIAAAELSKVELLRRELMANISHDLRTPLSLIYSYAEMMHDFPKEITQEQTQIIMDETERLTTLVNDVLDISKLETGMEQLNISDFNITQSIKATTDRIGELLKKEGYDISFQYDREVFVRADKVKIIQVYYNLLINAVNYTGEDKSVAVGQRVSDGSVRIEVSDTGEGIDPENLPYVWDRYYKVDKNHRRGVTGTGLGLSIVKKIMELHGGGFGVESHGDTGSTFWFNIKISESV